MFGRGRRKPDWVIVITGYFDESAKGNIFLVGGFIGDCSQWSTLEESWDITRKGRAIHLSKMRRNKSTAEILKELGPLPYVAGLQPFYVSVRPGDYRDMLTTKGERLALNPYPICLQGLLSLLNLKLPKHENIKLVFERNDIFDAHACVVFSQYEHIRTSTGGARFPSQEFFAKAECSLLQPADYLLYALRECTIDQESPKFKWSKPILDASPAAPQGLHLERNVIRELVKQAKEAGGDFGETMSQYLKEIRRLKHPKHDAPPKRKVKIQ